MKKFKTGSAAGIGGISLLAVFVILCFITFAVLSYLTASSDLSLSRRASVAVSEYYAAESLAEKEIARIVEFVIDNGGNLDDAGVMFEDEEFWFEIEINEYKVLYTKVRLTDNGFIRLAREVRIVREWDADGVW